MVSYNQIPAAVRVPFSYVEFSNSESSSASSVQQYKILLIGQMLAGGIAPAGIPVRILSENQARTAFGAGSMLSQMASASLVANNFTETWAIPLADDAAGVTAKSVLTITGPATGDGTISLYLGDKLYSVGVLSGDTATTIATALAAKISADSDSILTATVNATDLFKVDLAFKHKGVFGNAFSAKLGYYGETLPAGLSVTFTAFAGGTTNPSIATAITGMGDEQYRSIAMPYTDSGNLALIEAELARRWGPLLQNDGHAFSATASGSGGGQTLGLSQNSPFISIACTYGQPSATWKTAAVIAAVVAYNSAIDPARPLQTLELPGILPALPQDRLLLSDRNVLLYSGIATLVANANNGVQIERMVTTYRVDAGGNPDESYLDYEVLANLSYLRFDFRAYFGRKYPRHKLGKTGTRFAPGQAVITPLIAKAECVALFRNWEEQGLVEDGDQFKQDLIVEINALNPNRLDFKMSPNLINGLRIIANQIAFRS